MILNTKDIGNYQNLISLVTNAESFLFIEPKEKKLYIANSSIALRLSLTLEAEEEDNELYAFSKKEFFHIVNSCKSLHVKSDYSYNTGSFRGTFQTSESELDSVAGIKEMFTGEDSYSTIFSLDKPLIEEIQKAFLFVNKDDSNPSSRGVHITTNSISASSMYRIYTSKKEFNVNCFLPYTLTKTILETDGSFSLSKKENLYKLCNDSVTIIFAGMVDVSPLPVEEEKFQSSLSLLRDSISISFSIDTLLDSLNFLSFYAEKKKNGASKLTIDKSNKVCYIAVDDNTVDIPFEGEVNEDVEFYFNSLTLKEIFSKIEKGLMSGRLYCSKDNKLVMAELKENQLVLFAKINI